MKLSNIRRLERIEASAGVRRRTIVIWDDGDGAVDRKIDAMIASGAMHKDDNVRIVGWRR